MIQAVFETSENKETLILTVTGHAGQAEMGKDIICSAASMLTFTVAQIVNDMYNNEQLKKRPVIKLSDGDMMIVCKPKEDAYAEALHTYFVIQVGFNLLAHNHPEYVQLTPFVIRT